MLQQTFDQERVVRGFFERGFLLSPSVFPVRGEVELDEMLRGLEGLAEKPVVITDDVVMLLREGVASRVSWDEVDAARVLFEQGKDAAGYFLLLDGLKVRAVAPKDGNDTKIQEGAGEEIEGGKDRESLMILQHYQEKAKKRGVEDFVKCFSLRYERARDLLLQRGELKDATSIHRVLGKPERTSVAVIGMVKEKRETKNGNLMLGIEDFSGEIQVIVNKFRGNLFEAGGAFVEDEVIGVVGMMGNGVIFAGSLIYPD